MAQPGVRASKPTLSQAVVEAVADREGVDPTALEPSLYDVINPEALNHLFTTTHSTDTRDGAVTFQYCGYSVTVDSEATVSMDE